MKVRTASHERLDSPDPLASASAVIAEARRTLDRNLASLHAQLEWHDPRIAFYGETNAGKSTLIEALRLLFGAGDDRPGATIGDGRSDFTREAVDYSCDHAGKRFTLIDVPGIEGAEKEVIEQIDAAVRSAHLVFYVTPNARPPQSDDPGRLGMIGKIRQQLKPQAAVMAIYNKPMTTPRYLTHDLLDDGERAGLGDGPHSLDGTLRDALGARYGGHVAVSALPAFLSLASDLEPDSLLAARQRKFLTNWSREQLLDRSNLRALGTIMAERIPNRAAIIEGNSAKLRLVVDDVAQQLEQQAEAAFAAPARTLEHRLAKLDTDLAAIADLVCEECGRVPDQLAAMLVKRVSARVTVAIDAFIWRDRKLGRTIEDAMQSEIIRLEKVLAEKLRSIIRRADRLCKEAMIEPIDTTAHNDISDETARKSHDFAVVVKTVSGVDWSGLATIAVTIALSGPFPGTGLLRLLGGVGKALAAFGSVRNGISPAFRRNQQRKSLAENLHRVEPEVRTFVAESIKPHQITLREHILATSAPFRVRRERLLLGHKAMTEQIADLRDLTASDDRLCSHFGVDTLDSSGRSINAHA